MGTQKLGIILRKAIDFGITAYCDADWVDDTIDRRRKTWLLIYLGGSLVNRGSRKQESLARSSTKAEYMAIATTTQEVESVRAILVELGVQVPRPILILTDNLGASFITKNLIDHSKTRHVALILQFVRKKSKKGDNV